MKRSPKKIKQLVKDIWELNTSDYVLNPSITISKEELEEKWARHLSYIFGPFNQLSVTQRQYRFHLKREVEDFIESLFKK